MKNGSFVAAFEAAFAEYVGAKYAIATSNGTVSIEAALVALLGDGDNPNDWRVCVPPLTMSATTIAALNAGYRPHFVDVDPKTWLMEPPVGSGLALTVSLFGLHAKYPGGLWIDDAAQTLRKHDHEASFTSLSFQASKVLALGEGGALLTNDERLARRARSYLSLGYEMEADQARIDSRAIRSPDFERHHLARSINGRMNDLTAARGLVYLAEAGEFLAGRRRAAQFYAAAVAGCPWITPQYVPEGWTFDAWAYAFAVESVDLWHPLTAAMVRHGAEMPYGCWRITYKEPAFRHLAPDGTCPVAEDLQPRIVQCQTNNLESAERNANALQRAIQEVGGSR